MVQSGILTAVEVDWNRNPKGLYNGLHGVSYVTLVS